MCHNTTYRQWTTVRPSPHSLCHLCTLASRLRKAFLESGTSRYADQRRNWNWHTTRWPSCSFTWMRRGKGKVTISNASPAVHLGLFMNVYSSVGLFSILRSQQSQVSSVLSCDEWVCWERVSLGWGRNTVRLAQMHACFGLKHRWNYYRALRHTLKLPSGLLGGSERTDHRWATHFNKFDMIFLPKYSSNL